MHSTSFKFFLAPSGTPILTIISSVSFLHTCTCKKRTHCTKLSCTIQETGSHVDGLSVIESEMEYVPHFSLYVAVLQCGSWAFCTRLFRRCLPATWITTAPRPTCSTRPSWRSTSASSRWCAARPAPCAWSWWAVSWTVNGPLRGTRGRGLWPLTPGERRRSSGEPLQAAQRKRRQSVLMGLQTGAVNRVSAGYSVGVLCVQPTSRNLRLRATLNACQSSGGHQECVLMLVGVLVIGSEVQCNLLL